MANKKSDVSYTTDPDLEIKKNLLQQLINLCLQLINKLKENKNMKILGNVGIDTGGPYEINKVGLMKTLRMGLMVIAGSAISFLITNIVGLDIVKGTELDTMAVTMIVVPGLEFLRRYLTDYTQNDRDLGMAQK